ncbi:hypothetical protein [Stutzerimonas kirkiae]|uniref:Uncharacterized protein n=1 Tax=Stutzerimonas kirkiae TaxID=2211392 RepID=A0A4Q9RDZ7_9GAMM|nr:hypothetical protein [Stutzerimonas kirkiae]TBU98833.1 hypothetical protein DNJ96_03725 [Stutzerimonas kirkiae]TBV03927.1 hypothetical protein DNJ95_06135 [Stutzerimonas kirkiae]TBV09661.1 hypothetical protein DNK08_08505 [Stutzerimonas kirkiae]TBV16806.1 hypothetical protein DNK01_02845 [Stutzerimonas kirkiae]
MKPSLDHCLQQATPLFAETWAALGACLQRAGIDQGLSVAGMPNSRSELREDPFDHSLALYAEWRGEHGGYLGSILLTGDGQVFAEFDILLPHPGKPQWVIEAVTAWGWPGALKSELRLLPALGA